MSPCRAHSIIFVFTHPHPVGDESTGSGYSGSTVFPQITSYKLQVSFIRHVHTVTGTMYSEMFSAGFRDCATTTIKKNI